MRIDKKEVGKRLRELRKDSNLTLAEVASRCGVSGKSTVNTWEKGRAYPKKHIDKLAKMYRTTVDYLNFGILGDESMSEEDKLVGSEIIANLDEYKEYVKRLTTKLALENCNLEDSYSQTTDGSLLYRVYDREVKQQILMRSDNIVGQLTRLLLIIEEVSKKIANDIEEG